MINLLPCPFCANTRGRPKVEELARGGWRVICYGCLAEVFYFEKDVAISRWNTRITKSDNTILDELATATSQVLDELDEYLGLPPVPGSIYESKNGPTATA